MIIEAATCPAGCDGAMCHCQECGDFKPATWDGYCARCCEHAIFAAFGYNAYTSSQRDLGAACTACGRTRRDLLEDLVARLELDDPIPGWATHDEIEMVLSELREME